MSPSTKLTPAARTSTTTWPFPGVSGSRSSRTSPSSGPNSRQTTARMAQNLPPSAEGAQVRRSRNAPTTLAKDDSNASMSSAVVDQPTDRRRDRSATTPIASSTGDGSSVSEEQDD